MKIYRAFINQPSTLQPLHTLNGVRCLVQDNGGNTIKVFFTSGPVHSMQIPRNCVSRLRISAAG
jgi:hypothetical protein